MNLLGGNLALENSTFEHNFLTSNLLIASALDSINFTNVVFEENFSQNLISIITTNFIILEKFLCLRNNAQAINSLLLCGSCLFLQNFAYFVFQNSQIKEGFSTANPSGLILINLNSSEGKIQILNSIFSNNFFSSNLKFIYPGTALFLLNINMIFIQKCLFYNNSNNLENLDYGGPAMICQSQFGILDIDESYFIKNKALRGSLSIEFTGLNLSIKNSQFSNISQIDNSFLYPTAVLLIGTLDFLSVFNCTFGNNQAVFGLFFLMDKNLTTVILDNITLFENYASFTPGVYIVSETINKLVIWQNSLIVFHNFMHDVLLLYLYLTTPIVQFKMYFLNNTVSKNSYPYSSSAFNNIFNIWGYSNNVTLIIARNKFENNYNNWCFFSIFGIKPLLRVFITECLIFNNSQFNILAIDHVTIYCSKTVFANNNLMYGYLVGSLTVVTLEFVDVFICNQSVIGVTMIYLTENSEFFVKNLTIAHSNEKSMDLFTFDGLKQVILNSLTILNVTCTNVINFNIYNIAFVNFLTLIQIKSQNIFRFQQTTANFQKILLSFCEYNFVFFLEKNSFLNISYFSEQFTLNNSSVVSSVLFSQESSFFMFKSWLDFQLQNLQYSQFQLISSNLTFIFLNISSFISNQPLISLQKGILLLQNISFYDTSYSMNTQKSKIMIKNSTFVNNFGHEIDFLMTQNAFIFTNSLLFILKNNCFQNIIGINSPIIIMNSVGNNLFSIINSTFFSMMSINSNGGAISSFNLKIQVINCSFTNNFAGIDGGALYLFCSAENVNFCFQNISSNIFINNNAISMGRAYKWEILKPIESDNIFVNNSAKDSYDYVSCFCKLGFELIEIDVSNNETIVFNSFGSNSSDLLELQNENSLTSSFYLKFYPLDYYNHILSENNINNSINFYLQYQNKSDETCASRIIGKTSQLIDPIQNVFIFNDIQIMTCPNSTLYMNFSYNFPPFPSNIYDNMNSLNEQTQFYSIIIKVTTPLCQIGEIFYEQALICEQCQANYYSLNINDLQCNPCPDNAFCPGGDQIDVNPNYWRMNNSINIYECDQSSSSCLGGINSLCGENYMGLLCLDCQGLIQKNYIGICEKCPNIYLNILANIGFYLILIWTFSYLILVYDSKRISPNKKIIIKILINYIHFLFLTQRYNDNPYQSSLEIYVFLKMTFWFSFNCLINTFISSNNFILRSIAKFFIFYFSLFVFIVICNLKKKKFRIKLILMFLYSIYPFMLIFLFENIVCQQIENKIILKITATVDCTSDLFTYFYELICIPNVILVVFVIPMVYLIKKYQKAKLKAKMPINFISFFLQGEFFNKK